MMILKLEQKKKARKKMRMTEKLKDFSFMDDLKLIINSEDL
jgi:hypothetical protein